MIIYFYNCILVYPNNIFIAKKKKATKNLTNILRKVFGFWYMYFTQFYLLSLENLRDFKEIHSEGT